MCGLAGEFFPNRRAQPERVHDLVTRIAHRGPDDRGLWTSDDGHCSLGHARLSIIDLSPLGHQPMLDATSGNAIVFNGEIYNFKELREQCQRRGDVFRSGSDTEVILALYRRHGKDCLQQLRGMFAFAIWDAANQSLFMARDRVGKKPFNYALVDDGIVFCSEIDPLAHHTSVSTDIDMDALELYLQLQYIPAPWTIYRSVRKLPAAHYAIFDRDGLRLHRYWDVDYRAKRVVSDERALEEFEENLSEAVRLRMIADVPLGALLSGGVDSSVVVALMAKLSSAPVRTYSIGFQEDAFNELPFAEQVARQCGTIHHPEVVAGDVRDLLPILAQRYGEPFADSSAVPSFFVSRSARRHVTVALNGDGGDELLGGYPRYWLGRTAIATGTVAAQLMRTGDLATLAAKFEQPNSIAARAGRRLLLGYVGPELHSMWMYGAFWNDSARRELMGQSSSSGVLESWRSDWLREVDSYADNPIDRMLWMDNRTYLAGDLLTKMDIASMHCGLETRSPLLDHKVIEHCAGLAVEHKVRHRTGKYLLKRLAERYFPREFVHRTKMGFGIPLAQWLRGPLRSTVHELLHDSMLTDVFDRKRVRQLLSDFETSDAEASRVWSLLMFCAWRFASRTVAFGSGGA